ncbi:MAG: nodulation protein NfeD [Gemmatimonadota bacterium]|nr:nodulation protein NfeD [Gemmatimonadota bacterium]
MRNEATALVLLCTLTAPLAGQEAGDGRGTVYRVPVNGVIELGLAPFIERSVREAESADAVALVLDIDTPGGRVDAAERITDALSDAAIPVHAYINRRAFSAGAMISLAADEIHMRPGAVIGAATPVVGSGERAPEKIVSAMRSTMRALAEARGLDPRVAEAMVDEDIEIPGVVEAGKLLTLTTEEAVELEWARAVEDWEALMLAIGAAGAPVQDADVNWAERIVRFFTHPAVAPLLLSLGFLGLIVEVQSPGLGLAGAVGLVALSLFFGSHLLIGLAGLEGLILFVAGLVLIALEVFLVPGVGVLGFLGAAGVLGGLYMSLLGELPTAGDFGRGAGILSTSILIVLVASWYFVRRLPSNRRLGRSGVFLRSETARETGYASAVRREDLVGRPGIAATDLRPSGTGIFGGERIDVVSEAEWVQKGTAIEVVASEGYRHVVRPMEATEAPTPEGDAS